MVSGVSGRSGWAGSGVSGVASVSWEESPDEATEHGTRVRTTSDCSLGALFQSGCPGGGTVGWAWTVR